MYVCMYEWCVCMCVCVKVCMYVCVCLCFMCVCIMYVSCILGRAGIQLNSYGATESTRLMNIVKRVNEHCKEG